MSSDNNSSMSTMGHILLRSDIVDLLSISAANQMHFDGQYSKEYPKQIRRFIAKLLKDYVDCKGGSPLYECEKILLWKVVRDCLNKKTKQNYTVEMVRSFYQNRVKRKMRANSKIIKMRRRLMKHK